MPENPNHQEDRPLECSECKKPIAVRYTEIVGGMITRTITCADCPFLQGSLFGMTHPLPYTLPEGGAGLACGNCGTTLNAVRTGALLGCKYCYEVFAEVIVAELEVGKRLPARISPLKKNQPLHIGKTPGALEGISSTARLLALNEALTETLKREDYEQAALLRDQIKAITDENLKKEEGDAKQ